MPNRTKQDILVEMLKAMDSPVLRTYVMYMARLSHSQLKYYHNLLTTKGMIAQVGEKWVITEKGRAYLKACMLADEILEEN
jgi:predicted transcriptional regulator